MQTRAVLTVLACCLALGCTRSAPPPTERVLIVRDEAAPGLTSPKKKGQPVLMGHRGDVYLFEKNWGPFEWEGKLEGQEAKRSSDLLQIKRSQRDNIAFLFASDLMPDVLVPTSEWFCSTSPRPLKSGGMPCHEMLLRILIDGDTMAGHVPCASGPCWLGLAHRSQVTWIDVPNLLRLEQRRLNDRPLLVALQGRNEGAISGANLLVFGAEPGLPRLLEVPQEVVDASAHPTMRYRSVTPSFTSDTLVLEGTERELNATTGQQISSRPVKETYRLGRKGLERG